MNINEEIKTLLTQTKRPGMDGLLNWMDASGFYNAPCSSKFHLAKPGGLAEHSLNVCRTACAMVESFYLKQGKPFTQEFLDSVVISALLHDLGKAGQFGKPGYIIEKILTDETPSPYPIPVYATNKELLYVPHEVRSIAIASKFIDLTEEEQFAILYHNGLYGELEGFKGKEIPLYLIIHFADMWAARVIEE